MSWLSEQLQWMYWTPASAAVFAILFGCIGALAVLDRFVPGYARKGFLPIATTRGDRFFVSVLVLIAVHIAWISIAGTTAPWGALLLGTALFAVVMRWG